MFKTLLKTLFMGWIMKRLAGRSSRRPTTYRS